MDSHNTETEKVVSEESVELDRDESDMCVLNWDDVNVEDLAIADEEDLGGDPYNSTGHHVIIEPRINLED